MLFHRYLPSFPASILEPLLNMHTASYMSVISNLNTKGHNSIPINNCPKSKRGPMTMGGQIPIEKHCRSLWLWNVRFMVSVGGFPFFNTHVSRMWVTFHWLISAYIHNMFLECQEWKLFYNPSKFERWALISGCYLVTLGQGYQSKLVKWVSMCDWPAVMMNQGI